MNSLPGTTLDKANNFWNRVNRYAVYVGMVVLLFMMLLVVFDALGRTIFRAPIPGATEGTGLLMPYIVFLALAYALVIGAHVRVTILLDRFPSLIQQIVNVVDSIIGVAFFSILTYYGWQHFWESFIINEFMMAPIKLLWWPGKFGMPLGTIIMAVQVLILLVGYIAKLVNRDTR